LELEANEATVEPIYVIGDSHALPYRNLMFRESWTGSWASVHAKYVSGLTAHDFFEPSSGDFHPAVIEFLEFEGLVRNGKATHLSSDEVDFSIHRASGKAVTPPLLLFTMGCIDVRGAILPVLRDTHDFVPNFETELPLLDRPLIPWDVIDSMIRQRVDPMIAGLQQLMNAGFNRLYVQLVVPPTRDEARAKQLQGYETPVSIRTKLVMAFNRYLENECKRIGVKTISLWPSLTEGGYLRPDLEVDGVHVPPKAAKWFVEALIEDAVNCQWFAINHVRYEMFYRMACGLEPFGFPSSSTA